MSKIEERGGRPVRGSHGVLGPRSRVRVHGHVPRDVLNLSGHGRRHRLPSHGERTDQAMTWKVGQPLPRAEISAALPGTTRSDETGPHLVVSGTVGAGPEGLADHVKVGLDYGWEINPHEHVVVGAWTQPGRSVRGVPAAGVGVALDIKF